MPASTAAKRSYLSREDRRQLLLETASQIVEERGWPGLTMISLADEAAVSRQLVYQHFRSIRELWNETIRFLWEDHYQEVRRQLESPGFTLADLVSIGEQQFKESPARQRALWQIMTVAGEENSDAVEISRSIRRLTTDLWGPVLARVTGLSRKRAGALAWSLNMAIWGNQQLVEDKALSKREAQQLNRWLIEKLQR